MVYFYIGALYVREKETKKYSKDRGEYTYDAGSNLLREHLTIYSSSGAVVTTQDTNYAYTDTNWKDKLTSYGGKSITYDEIGNPLSYRGMKMTWQNGRQLSTLQKGTTAVSYTYDADSTRATKTVNGVKYTYQYLGGKLVHETRGEKSFHYYYDANGYLTSIKYRLTPTGQDYAYYATHNWRGDVVGLYNGDGDLKAKYEYDTWGKVISVKDANGTRITDQNHVGNLNPFRYRGYYYDTETGLYYLMTRYYDPVTHRFLNADGYFQSGDDILDTNMNAYCRNNPVNRFDPTGQDNNCSIHGNHFWQPNCVECRPGYKDQLQKEAERGQPIWMPDGGTLPGGTMFGEAWGVEIRTNKLTFVPPLEVKDLKERKDDYLLMGGSFAGSLIDWLTSGSDPTLTGGIAILYSALVKFTDEKHYRMICDMVDKAAENGNGIVIIDAPYDTDFSTMSPYGYDQFAQWSGSYGQYPYAIDPYR